MRRNPLHFSILTFLFLTIFISSCNMSYDEARGMAPYKGLSEADAKWLYEHHQTDFGALSWLEDEIHFLDGGFQIWITSDGNFEMENQRTRKTFKIKSKKAVSMVKKEGGIKAAEELVELAREETGGEPQPGVEVFSAGLTEDVQKAQRLRYPEVYPRTMNYYVGESLTMLGKIPPQLLNESDSLNDLKEVIRLSVTHLGEDHLRTHEAMGLYYEVTGENYVEFDSLVSQLDSGRLTRSSQIVATTDKMIKGAEELWSKEEYQNSITMLQNAYNLSKVHFKDNHPQVLKIQQLGNQAEANISNIQYNSQQPVQ